MEWASAINLIGSRFVTRVMTRSGVRCRELATLVSGGLPTSRSARLVIEQNLTDWQLADPREYIQPFGLHAPGDSACGHAVFEARVAGKRVLIPALSMMRAFFRPTRYLLPQMFCPQALSRVLFVDSSEALPTVKYFTETWRNLEGSRYGDVTGPLAWMTFFESAARFASSVHRHARDGRIALELPIAEARLAVWGIRSADCFRATHLTVLSLQACENPVSWAGSQSRAIYRRNVVETDGPSPELRDASLPVRPDGTVDLSDDEWAEVEPVLFPSNIRHRRLNLPPRLIFDGLLRKLAHGTAWRNTNYPVGGHLHARYWYRRWNESGRFAAAIERLVQLRMRVSSG